MKSPSDKQCCYPGCQEQKTRGLDGHQLAWDPDRDGNCNTHAALADWVASVMWSRYQLERHHYKPVYPRED